MDLREGVHLTNGSFAFSRLTPTFQSHHRGLKQELRHSSAIFRPPPPLPGPSGAEPQDSQILKRICRHLVMDIRRTVPEIVVLVPASLLIGQRDVPSCNRHAKPAPWHVLLGYSTLYTSGSDLLSNSSRLSTSRET